MYQKQTCISLISTAYLPLPSSLSLPINPWKYLPSTLAQSVTLEDARFENVSNQELPFDF